MGTQDYPLYTIQEGGSSVSSGSSSKNMSMMDSSGHYVL
jgi:hypothetical protein